MNDDCAVLWRERLGKYLDAKRRDDEAKRVMLRAERTFGKLARRIGDERAYIIAGVSLADNRSIRTSREKRRVGDELKASLRDADTLTRLATYGAVMCADHPRAGNDA